MIGLCLLPPNLLQKATNTPQPQPKRRMTLWHWALLALLYLLFCYWFFYQEPVRYAPIQPTTIERAAHKERLKYHGLDRQVSVIHEENGKEYFYRDGKKCTF